MKFYKIIGMIRESNDEDCEKYTRTEFARLVTTKTVEFNSSNNTKYCFLSDFGKKQVTFGVVADERTNLLDWVDDYARLLGLEVDIDTSKEITLASFQNILNHASRQSFIDDDDTILECLGLDRIANRRLRGLEFGENLINNATKKEDLFASAKKIFANETLLPELNRIYEGSKCLTAFGHPVHYIIESDNKEARRDMYKIILDALYDNGRLQSCRYSFLDFTPYEIYSKMSFETLYKISEGGAVIVRYLAGDDYQDDANSAAEYDIIDNICETAKRYRNKVLTIFCFPRECKRVKSRFYENLGTMSFVELREDFIGGQKVKQFLSSLAKAHNVRVDKKLFTNIKANHSYLATELQYIFDEWYNYKLKTTVYPQYKDVSVAHKEIVKSKPQGTAYDEFMEMIGLNDAKQVIKKALNYYKMQNFYEEKGVKRDNPAMHMIFSGNPGTAKTTVARLFARIMRENGLLSGGHLVEVGRGDLVGKYVGWTAQMVQAKFKEASGGVLFIDEAYSLVDYREGSFGDEAINTIVQEMENHRTDVVVIFAGYPDKMQGFLDKNPGLRSRIAFHVPFSDYESYELCEIANLISKKNGMKIEKDALDKLEKVFEAARVEKDFGNGRYVRNIFEQAKMNQASRLLEKDFDSITADEVTTITADDIVIPTSTKPQKNRIGFC